MAPQSQAKQSSGNLSSCVKLGPLPWGLLFAPELHRVALRATRAQFPWLMYHVLLALDSDWPVPLQLHWLLSLVALHLLAGLCPGQQRP